MIQLPSKIRTTLFYVGGEAEVKQLFSHEPDRIVILIYGSVNGLPTFAVGRSRQEVLNGASTNFVYYYPLTIYGPEPLWIGKANSDSFTPTGTILVHGIYRA